MSWVCSVMQAKCYGLLIPMVLNKTGRANDLLLIFNYMLGSNQATRLPNCKQRSGGKIGKQTIRITNGISDQTNKSTQFKEIKKL